MAVVAAAPKKNTWIVTGCSNGMGLALARYILTTGDNVIATSRNPSNTPELVEEIQSHPNGAWLRLDVLWTQDEISEAIGAADALFDGGITVTVNNAGYVVLGAIEDMAEADAKAEFETNVWGCLRVCKAIIPKMRQRKSGTIVQISSVCGLAVFPALGMYSASKFALEGKGNCLTSQIISLSQLQNKYSHPLMHCT